MVLSLNFEDSINHDPKWYLGYQYDCINSYNKNNGGPKNGTKIKFCSLPKTRKPSFLRFWAAKHNKNEENWVNSSEAYNENSDKEEEPTMNYFNGGLVKIDKNGCANIRLILPSGYTNNQNQIENPHIHFRICTDGRMSGVLTQEIKVNNIDSSLGTLKTPGYLLNKY